MVFVFASKKNNYILFLYQQIEYLLLCKFVFIYVWTDCTTGYPLIPYGLPCVRELFRFLISLTNPVDRHNTDVMIHMGLSLLTVALETGADHISCYNSLLYLVKDELCRSLSMVRYSL